MAAGTIEDLTVRAALDIAGITRGTQAMVRELSRAKQEIESSLGSATLPDLSADAQRQAEDLASTFTISLADGIEEEAQRVSDALESTLAQASEAASQAVQASSQEAVQSMRELAVASEEAAPEIRSWEDWANAVRASNQAARETALAQAEVANAQREVVNQTRLSAEEVDRLETQYAARQAARRQGAVQNAAATARQQAVAQGEALRRQLESDQARIKVAQLNQLLKPREAAEAARISAEAYNRELRRVIARGEAAGAFTGRQGQQAFNQLAGSISNLDRAAGRSTGGLARLNNSMVVIARQAAGAHPAVGQLVDVVGTFALGTGVMVGVLAGLAAIAAAYRKITEDSREARREQERALEALRQIQRQREIERLGPGGEAVEQVAIQRAAQAERIGEIRRLTAQIEAAFASADEAQQAAIIGLARRRDRLQREYDEAAQLITEGEREIADRLQQSASTLRRQEAQNLAALVASNDATIAERVRARELLEQEMLRLRQLSVLSTLPGLLGNEAIAAERAGIISTIEQLTRALEGPKKEVQETDAAFQRLAQTLREIAVTSAFGAVDLGDLPANVREAFQDSERLRTRLESMEDVLGDVARAGGEVPEAARRAVEDLRRAVADSEAELQELVRSLGLGSARIATIGLTLGGIAIENEAEVRQQYEEEVRRIAEEEAVRAQLNLELLPRGPSFAERQGVDVTTRDDAVERAREATETFNENIDAGREVLSAFGDLADTSESLSEAFSDTLRGLETFAQGIQRIEFGRALAAQGESILGGLAQASGIISAFAGATTVIGGFINAGRERERAEIRAADALERFRLELDGFRVTPDLLRGVFRGVEEAIAEFPLREDVARSFRSDRGLTRANIEPILADLGITFAQVQAAADDLGIEILTASGYIDPDAFRELATRAREASAAVDGFRDSLADRQLERDLRDRIQGVERTAQQDIAALFGDLSELSNDVFAEYFRGLDFSDVEAVRARLLQAYNDFSDGGMGFAELMGEMTREEWLEWVGLVADSLSEMDEAIDAATSTFRGVPEIFNYTLASIRAAGTRDYVPAAPLSPVIPPPNFTPPSGPNTEPGRAGPTFNVQVSSGAIQIDASTEGGMGPALLTGLTEAIVSAMRAGGATVTPQMIEQIRRDLKPSLERAAATAGYDVRELARLWPA